jgi:hypothetical protein
MSLYIAPESIKKTILDHLSHPAHVYSEKIVTFEEARVLVNETCMDATQKQPAVKLASFCHEFIDSAWFGSVLHFYGPFTGGDKPILATSKFLFHGSKQTDPWTLVEFAASE